MPPETPPERKTPPPIRYQDMAPTFPEGEIDVRALVPGDGPIELEIGFGRGAFLLGRAVAAPGSRVIGVEIKSKWAYLVEQRRIGLSLGNARAFGADIREVLPLFRPDASLTRVFVHFPDPWWKKRHAKRRVLEDTLLDELARLLAPGAGELFVQTDVEDRASELVALLRGHSAYRLCGDASGLVAENPFGARSNREARAAADGLPVYRVLARRA
jgi:tRNA (guanine-N7-)-methyltransferase